MKWLLDTNIVVDVLSKRNGYEDSFRLLQYCEADQAAGFISATTVTDVVYILRKYIPPETVRDAIKTLLTILDVADVLKSDISAAFLSGMADLEDAVQASCANRIRADYIVTRDIRDFKNGVVPAILPEDMITIMKNSQTH
ncbi:MAG: PIN domain-containing protein [Oscillospiraceae bacterium]|nr:PIN domain-containing protein [Oscillospiraceae bacterium]